MRAVGLMKHGGPEVLQVVDLPEEQAGAGQIRIQVRAAAVNPTDTMARNGWRADQQKAFEATKAMPSVVSISRRRLCAQMTAS